MDYDITFCARKDCNATYCKRHVSHIPIGIPVSVAEFDCPFWPIESQICVKTESKKGGKNGNDQIQS